MESAVSVFPQPDSPTRHRVLPGLDPEADIANRVQGAGGDRDVDVQPIHLEQCHPGAPPSVARLGRGDVAQPVAEQVDREHQEEQGNARDRDQPGDRTGESPCLPRPSDPTRAVAAPPPKPR